MITAMIGMGANLGDPVQQIVDARVSLLALKHVHGGKCSSLYLSSPVGYSEQPDFVNCVMALNTQASPHRLLADMQAIETDLGRLRVADNQDAPRLIDLDLLLFGDHVISTERLQLPHPRMHERLFVLAPLDELQPNLRLNELGKVCDLISDIAAHSDQVLYRLSL